MAQSPQEALMIGVVLAALAGLAVGGGLRFFRLKPMFMGLAASAAFLLAYVVTYNKVPSFPPVGAVNKIFYIAAAGAVLGLIVDLTEKARLGQILNGLQPVLAAIYIGQSRLPDGYLSVAIAAAVGLAIVLSLQAMAAPSAGEASMRRAIVLVIACIGFAPIALLGASSSSFQLLLVFAFGIAGLLVCFVFDDGFALGSAFYLGAIGGILSVAYTVTLITAKFDPLALAVHCLTFAVPLIARRIPMVDAPASRLARLTIYTFLCLLPAAAAVIVAIVSYGTAFPI
jgi:hypothetical protein